jgi:7,8-dihydropterin-6-yl-methyl-4-(beta-D-ribofuranosyl)aminobenzene 5'-phosphate synthase
LQSSKGIAVFSGCAHRGVRNIIDAVKEHFPEEPIAAFFGGFHMSSPSTGKLTESVDRIAEIARGLVSGSAARFYTGHCTGLEAYATLKTVMGDRVNIVGVGEVVEL